MNVRTNESNQGKTGDKDGILEQAARTIVPPSREISDEEIFDPGANTPSEPAGSPGRDKPVQGGRR